MIKDDFDLQNNVEQIAKQEPELPGLENSVSKQATIIFVLQGRINKKF